MRIMVFDVPAESGGALSVLHEFYDEFKLDQENEYIFVLSVPELKESNNIIVLRFPWIKDSWFHRLYFDHLVDPGLIKKYKVDKVLSLQNIMIPHTKVSQSVFVHNALPLSEHRFSVFEDTLLWIYQNILSRSIFKSIIKSNEVIVQNEWMKKACTEKLNIDTEKVEVRRPKININVKTSFERTKGDNITFFYPANSMTFKNHKIIVEACMKLKESGLINYKVVFTLNGNENKKITDLYRIVRENNLPITFVGKLTREQVFDYYSKAVLVFPSYIETVGLPLIEAKLHGTPIIVSDCDFSREILDGYNNVCYFNAFDINEIAIILKKTIKDFC